METAMKKIHVILSLLFLFVSMGYSSSFLENRHQWWEARLHKLAAEKARLQKNGAIDRKVPGMIDNEMAMARGIIAIFKRGIRDDESTNCTKMTMTESAVRKHRNNLNEKIAREEIDALYRHTEECVILYEKFRYAEDALPRYEDAFNSLMKEAGAGTISPSHEHAVTMNSLVPVIQNFDCDRIQREYATRLYLRREAKTAMARLITLSRFYKKNRVMIRYAALSEDIADLERRINTAPRARIDAWVMTESSVSEIDKKAVRKLSLILNRKSYKPAPSRGQTEQENAEASNIISLEEPEFSLNMPQGWEEGTVGKTESFRGVVKSFHSGDGTAMIQLVKLPLDADSDSVKSIAEDWIRTGGCTLVEKKWGKTGALEYLWILARDKKRNISETCSLSKDGYALLIQGTTSRDHYLKFKAQFRKIIDSLRAGAR
ncbi:MAG: hypothetical protein A2176_12675 [Spirochaetes bacterium RBG_13_51_14]|nr:MAG: hypothetical protein A2176_12675 [Spirochaetes bacterium RBG_13_51_14]